MRCLTRFAVLLMLLITMAGCAVQQADEPTPTPLPPPPEPTLQVQRGEVIQQVQLTGSIGPAVTVGAAFGVEGKIETVYVAQYEEVTAGEVLADLNVLDELEEELELAREEAEAQAKAAQEVIRRAEIALEIAQLSLKVAQAQGRSAEEIRIEELKVEVAQMDLDKIIANLDLQSSGRVSELETAIENARLYAPMDGQLLSSLSPGRNVRPNTPVAVVGDPSVLELVVSATDEQLEILIPNMTVSITLDDKPDDVLAGYVRVLPYPYGNSATEDDGTVRITLISSPEEAGYKIGDAAHITAVIAQRDNVLWVPPDVIRNVAGRTFVIVKAPAGLQRVDVKTGVASRDRVEIIEGLSEGQIVIAP